MIQLILRSKVWVGQLDILKMFLLSSKVSLDSALAVFTLTAAGQECDKGRKLSLLTADIFTVESKNRWTPWVERTCCSKYRPSTLCSFYRITGNVWGQKNRKSLWRNTVHHFLELQVEMNKKNKHLSHNHWKRLHVDVSLALKYQDLQHRCMGWIWKLKQIPNHGITC